MLVDGTSLARVGFAGARDGDGSPVLLGLEDDVPLFAVERDPPAEVDSAVSLREAGALLSAPEGGLAAYAVALLGWHRRHRFCSNCGAETEVGEAGLVRLCPSCGLTHFPRMDPVVIMLVEDPQGRLLLGRRPSWPPERFSALAGFVSAGESLEEAVVREVYEESGIRAREPRYVASQPWPFPSSLMLGFHAMADGGEPVTRDDELEAVRWFTEEEVRSAQEGSGEGPFVLPPPVAIARFLIERWLGERAAGAT